MERRHCAGWQALLPGAVLAGELCDYLAAVELLAGRRGTLLGVLEQQVPGCSHAPVIARLRCFPGIDTLSAAGVCAELGSFGRFPRPDADRGLPRDRSLRTHLRPQTPPRRDHQGRARARPPAAGRSRPSLPPAAAHRREARPPPTRPRPARDRNRLARPTAPLPALAAPARRRKKPAGVVAIAVTRELAAFLWEAATLD